jgi:hypothetical protein
MMTENAERRMPEAHSRTSTRGASPRLLVEARGAAADDAF